MILVRREDEGEDEQEDKGDDEGGLAHNRLGPRFVDQVCGVARAVPSFFIPFLRKNLPSVSRRFLVAVLLSVVGVAPVQSKVLVAVNPPRKAQSSGRAYSHTKRRDSFKFFRCGAPN